LAKKNEGKILEQSIEQSCSDQSIYFFRVRDVNPMALKPGFKVPQNKFDCLIFHKGHLFPTELKSTKAANISMKESMIKAHQIKSLKEATIYENVIPGFIFNFREPANRAFFIHIDDFITYQNIAENQLEHTYKSKINKSSIPIGICEEIGIEITNMKKQVNYRYYLNRMIDELIVRFGE
jgi:penicillin-binding protein-related factor A (putative recombinase)